VRRRHDLQLNMLAVIDKSQGPGTSQPLAIAQVRENESRKTFMDLNTESVEGIVQVGTNLSFCVLPPKRRDG
jgi:hypothetical protein